MNAWDRFWAGFTRLMGRPFDEAIDEALGYEAGRRVHRNPPPLTEPPVRRNSALDARLIDGHLDIRVRGVLRSVTINGKRFDIQSVRDKW